MAELTEVEKELILEFRQRIADIKLEGYRNHDMHLVTWLRARDHCLKRAEEMFRKSDNWLKVKNFNDITKDWKPPEEYSKKFPMRVIGYDEDDSPVLFAQPGCWDLRSKIEAGEKDVYLKYQTYVASDVLEHIREITRQKNKFVSQFVVILDLAEYSLRQLTSYATVETHLLTIREFEANFPETLKACYIININKWFGTILNIVKPFLSGKTFSKLHVHSSNSEKWENILQNMNVDFKNFDESQHDNNNDEMEFEIANIKAGDQLKISLQIENSGSKLCWKYKTDSHDIGFGVEFAETSENVPQELIPVKRKSANQSIQENSLTCFRPGRYILVFDNTYSRYRYKTIYYSITIEDKGQLKN